MHIAYLVLIYFLEVNGLNSTTPNSPINTTQINCSDPDIRLDLQCIDDKLKGKSSVTRLLLVTCLSGIWGIYVIFFNSRILGFALSKIINQIYKDAYTNIGSFSFSVLSGKIMFRNVRYITKDYSVHLHDGYFIFRWWRPYKPNAWEKNDLNHGHTRVSVSISGFEYHVFNHTKEYDRIRTAFGQQAAPDTSTGTVKKKSNESSDGIAWWRNLVPVIKFSISYGRFVFGNRFLPNTMVISFNDGEFQYKTTEPFNNQDLFLHVVEGTLGSANITLVPSVGYDSSVTPQWLGITDVYNELPPRKMGEGYVVVKSNNVVFKYHWDEPGIVTLNDANTTKPPVVDTDPVWEMVVHFGKRTTFNFSPWADRQRELIWKFFYPPDYQLLEVTKTPEIGDLRKAKKFKLSAMLLKGADIDILFTKNEDVHAMQINTSEGSFVEVDIPMVVEDDGYSTHISGQLLHIEILTSMQYTRLLKAEMFGFDVKAHYPLKFNECQLWRCDIAISKASASLLFAHKDLIADLLLDWSSQIPPDVMFFVPYTFGFNIKLDQFEIFLPMNKYNWIDCNVDPKYNAYLGLHGKSLNIAFDLPFDEFLSPTYSIPFRFSLIGGQLCVFLPESDMTRNTLINLARQQKTWDDTKNEDVKSDFPPAVDWNRTIVKSWGIIDSEWVPCFEVPSMDLTITYTWHPIVSTLDISRKLSVRKRFSSEVQELSTPLTARKDGSVKSRAVTFDPTTLEPDEIRLDLELSPGCTLVLYGTLLDLILIFKENYLGYDDVYTSFAEKPHNSTEGKETFSAAAESNLLEFRPLQVTVNINLENINGILPILPNPMFTSQPTVSLKKLHFEMDKNYLQTRLQLLLADLDICVTNYPSSDKQQLQNESGRVNLSDLQFRGHAMFSGAGLPLGATQIEYAWLTEVLIGNLKGKLSVLQIEALIEWGELFVFLLSNDAHQLKKAFPNRILPTGITWDFTKNDGKCVEEDDVKYLMIRLKTSSAHLRFVQDNSLLDVRVSPVTVSNCNIQDPGISEAVSAIAEEVELKHRICKPMPTFQGKEEWMESAEVRLGPVLAQVAVAAENAGLHSMQDEFLRYHDRKTRRLEFLWDQSSRESSSKLGGGKATILENVKQMKSWGCSFFTPVTAKHPTFYYENASFKDRSRHVSRPNCDRTALKNESGDEEPGVDDSGEDEDDVFDSRLDFGMSLLADGKQLISRPSWIQHDASDAPDAAEEIIAKPEETNSKEPISDKSSLKNSTLKRPATGKTVSAGFLLMGDDPLAKSQYSAETTTKSEKLFAGATEVSVSETESHTKSVTFPKLRSSSYDDLLKKSRPLSTDSSIFQSTESDFKKSSTSVSSDAYFSAESDVENLDIVPTTAKDLTKSVSDHTIDRISTRPDELGGLPKPGVVRRLDLSDSKDKRNRIESKVSLESVASEASTPSPKKSFVSDNGLLSCYGCVLASSTFRDAEWMSEFTTVREGIHPSVIIDKDASSSKSTRRSSVDILEESNSSNCTKVLLHVKGGIDIQVTPFLLDSVQQAIDAITLAVTMKHPITVLNNVQMKCTSDAVTDYHLNKLEKTRGDLFSPGSNHSNTPGTKLEIFMDSLRVNIVQATLGDDPVFNLRLNKMLPTPCISVLAARLDQLDVVLELNSKQEKLLSKARKKNRLSSSNYSDENQSLQKESDVTETTFVQFLGHASVHSLACQMRVLSCDGCAPDRSNVTALSDETCRAPFRFNNQVLLPTVKESIERNSDVRKRPIKPWGWVMIEAGITKITADFVKYDAQVTSAPRKHSCDGNLQIGVLWLNVVSPPSPSQFSRSCRNFRSWNLLTSLSPSYSAWMASSDRLTSAIENLNQALNKSCFSTMGALLTMALENAKSVGKSLWQPRSHRYDVMTDLSKAVSADFNCTLCDALQRHLLEKNYVLLLESALVNESSIPALVTLETGIQVLLGQWLQLINKSDEKAEKSKKRLLSVADPPLTPRDLQTPGISYNGNLSIDTFLKRTNSPNVVNVAAENVDVPDEHVSLVSDPQQRPMQERAEELVYEQQQSMYSWMQNQIQVDIEAQHETEKKFVEEKKIKKIDKKETQMEKAQKTYVHFLRNVRVTQPSEVGTNFIQSHCSGSLFVKATLHTIRMDKQEPDRMYRRDHSRKRRGGTMASLRRQKFANIPPPYESPIILCHKLQFTSSAVDSLILEDSNQDSKDSKNQSSNNNTKKRDILKLIKNRSKLHIDVGCSLDLVKQKVDIALVRLVHQFIQCSDAIQQAITDMQVNKYTAGSVSPDHIYSHQRATSNVSSVSLGTPSGEGISRPSLRRRHTLGATTRDDGSIASSNTSSIENMEDPPCWKDLYKLVDQHSGNAVDEYCQDNFKFETDLKRGMSSVDHRIQYDNPFVSMELSGSLQLMKLQLLAEVGDLKISTDLCKLTATATHVRVSLSPFKHEAKSSITAGLQEVNADITEYDSILQKTIVTGHVGECNITASTDHQRNRDGGNVCSIGIGRIVVDLPQHPASLHDVVTRSTKQLTTHIQEFAQTPNYKHSFDGFDGVLPAPTPSNTTLPTMTPLTPSAITAIIDLSQDSSEVNSLPVVMSLKVKAEGFEVGTSLLSSLRAKYTTGVIEGDGTSGSDAEFKVIMPHHMLHFASQACLTGESGPVSTEILLPPISAEGEFKMHKSQDNLDESELQMKEGEYLFVSTKVGNFEHTITTDLFNQLAFLQEVFMHEINDVIQKMSRNDKPTTVWSDTSLKSTESQDRSLLYQLQLELDGIQLTATTPSRNAVRLKTGVMTFELSNRVMRGGKKLKNIPKYLKLFGKAQVDLNLALGILEENSVYPEVEPEFYRMAYFATRIGLQNTTQSRDNPSKLGLFPSGRPSEENNVILISLLRPIFFVQPTAFDKAILIFLAYKNAYEDWTEKRIAMEGDVLSSTRQVVNALQSRRSAHSTTSLTSSNSSLFLQLSLHDLGICLPVHSGVNSFDLSTHEELSSALVLTIDSTLISACYARSLVTTGHFKGFCLRFADDFQTSWDEWAPKNYTANSFVVPDGTYQICTDTTTYHAPPNTVARTTVNVVWQMKGMDVQLNTSIGTYLTHLYNTMTLITGRDVTRSSNASDKLHLISESGSTTDVEAAADDVPDAGLKSPSLATLEPKISQETLLKEKAKKVEQDYYEQVKVVNDLKSLGAKPTTIAEQEHRLHDLESTLSSMFRQTVKNKFRRTSLSAGSQKKDSSHRRHQFAHRRSVSAGRSFRRQSTVPGTYATLPSTHTSYLPEYADLEDDEVDEMQSNSCNNIQENSKTFPENSEESISGDGSDEVDGAELESDVAKDDLEDLHDRASFGQYSTQAETDLELILDIRVNIDGGRIVCQPLKEDVASNSKTNQSGPFRPLVSSSNVLETKDTIFYVPAVEIRIRYNSDLNDNKSRDFSTPPNSPKNPSKLPFINVESPGGTKTTQKRSCIYLWFSLQSLPEMIISPCFLDFLEQTLQVIPVTPTTSSSISLEDEGHGAVEAFDSTISSLPLDVVVFLSIQPSQVRFNCQPMSKVECLFHIPCLDAVFSSILDSSNSMKFSFADDDLPHTSRDSEDSFSQAFPSGLGITLVMSDFSIYIFHPYGAQLSSGLEQKGGSGRKDSLSVDLEVVKINIVRTKNGAVDTDTSFQLKKHAVVVNISALMDIGKASFKYDMRRLNEILAFPRAWYRRNIARRLFFGNIADEMSRSGEGKLPDSPLTPKRNRSSKTDQENKEEWQSVVLFALKMSRLDVQMNMSNVMGNTVWSCDGLQSQGKLTLFSSGNKDIFLSCGLDNSQLSAKGGIIGGNIELKQLYANCRLLNPVESEPFHKLCVKMRSLDGRIEYMGSCIMIGKLTKVCIKLSDEWKGPKLSMPASMDKSSVFVPGDIGWEDFSLAISRSTTPDVIKMLAKLEEFFTQQLQNSVRAISSWRQPGRSEIPLARQSSVTVHQVVYAFHRHWPSVYSAIRSLGVTTNFLLGGSLCLRGNQLTIVCFNGNNFRSRSWVLFNILEPIIMFSTEVQEIKESLTSDETSILSVQSLTFNLGHEYWLKTANAASDPMATVSRVKRASHENSPPSSASIDEWFAYVTASHKQELSMLRTLNDVQPNESSFNWSHTGGSSRSGSSSSYSHETDIIFALPKLQLDFKTEHIQGPNEPDPEGPDRPTVECSFVTEFTDHMCVTMDVELIMWLHDLITSYLKEKQQALSSRNRLSSVGSDHHVTNVDPIDLRQFVCNTWQLEPTVRLISWAGRRIEPVGVDYILQKLGFSHARTTIPKWFQRGVLDVLDQTLAVIVQNLVITMTQQKQSEK